MTRTLLRHVRIFIRLTETSGLSAVRGHCALAMRFFFHNLPGDDQMKWAIVLFLGLLVMLPPELALANAHQDSVRLSRQKSAGQARLEWEQLPAEEKKMDTPLLRLVQLSEKAKASLSARQQLSSLLTTDKSLRADERNRIYVGAYFRSVGDTSIVKAKILSLGGKIEFVARTYAYIGCKIELSNVRKLARLSSVTRLTQPSLPQYHSPR